MGDGGELTAHLTTGAIVVYLIEWAKKSNLIPMTASTKTLNRIVNIVFALAVSVGISWSYDMSQGTLVVKGLTAVGIANFFWEFLKQVVAQQILYDGVLAPKDVKGAAIDLSPLIAHPFDSLPGGRP